MKKITLLLLSMFFAVNFFAVCVFASDEFGAVDIHGFISQGYLDSDKHKYLCELCGISGKSVICMLQYLCEMGYWGFLQLV